MKKIPLNISYYEFEDEQGLLPVDRELLEKAKEVTRNSYAPYSLFRVGAAVLLENDVIVTGSNQENVAFPAGQCAERVALLYAASTYPGIHVKTIAVTAWSESEHLGMPVTPCGACRQVMSEIENRSGKPIRIIMQGMSGRVILVEGVETLLPLTFQADHLKKENRK